MRARLSESYSDNFPPDFFPFARSLRAFPSAAAVDILKTHGTRYVIVHLARYAEDQCAAVVDGMAALDGRLHPLLRQDTVELYEGVR